MNIVMVSHYFPRAEGDLSGKRILYSLTLGNTAVAKDVATAFERALGTLVLGSSATL